MEAFIKQLRDDEGNVVYPVTRAKAVYMPNGIDTVERVLTDMDDYDTTIRFSGQTIEQTLASGGSSTTEFQNQKIVETTRDDNGTIIKTKTTTFNADGSIRIEVK